MKKSLEVSLLDVLNCFSQAIELVNQIVMGHHREVAYITMKLSKQLELSSQKKHELLIAATLHDIGALYATDGNEQVVRLENSENEHAEIGYLLIKNFKPFAELAPLIRYHHQERWEQEIYWESNILTLADYVSLLIDSDEPVLEQVDAIKGFVTRNESKKFSPEVVAAFVKLSKKESFWFSLAAKDVMERAITDDTNLEMIKFDLETLISLTRLFSQIVDFRSAFTATHTDGVSIVAQSLAELMGLDDNTTQLIKVAGYLHDLGKLAVPKKILNKKGSLTKAEFNIIKEHPFHTYRILDSVAGFAKIKRWAAFHHERCDGGGYPFKLSGDKLGLESKVMAVADVFTAITEDRPYREGMKQDKVAKILTGDAKDGKLNQEIVDLLLSNYQYLDKLRVYAQKDEANYYRDFRKKINLQINRS